MSVSVPHARRSRATGHNSMARMWMKLTLFVGVVVIVCAGVLALVVLVHDTHFLSDEITLRLSTVTTLRQQQVWKSNQGSSYLF